MSRNDARPGQNRLQQETIFGGRTARRYQPCPLCGKPTDVFPMKKFPGCTGYGCTDRRGCKWEADVPKATLDAQGRLVAADSEGRPTATVLFDPNQRDLSDLAEGWVH